MTEAELAAIEARAQAASEGPWGVHPFTIHSQGAGVRTAGGIYVTDLAMPHNATFIAAARTDVPALVAEVRRLREVIERAQYEAGMDRCGLVSNILNAALDY